MPEEVTFTASQIGDLSPRDDRDLVERYGKFAAPYFIIEISDKSEDILYSAESQINEGGYDLIGMIVSGVEYDETDCQASMISLTVQNPNVDLHDSRLFAEGNNIDLWMGYDGRDPDYMGRGIITEIEPMFESGSIPSINIKAYDIGYFMMEEGRAEIVPEGTAWYQRVSQSSESSDDNGDQSETSGSATQENIRSRNRDDSSIGGLTDETQWERDLTGATSPPSQRVSSTSGERSTSEVRTTSWEQWQPPRRSRNSGKVWREMTDTDIVKEIFRSYGIVPFAEIVNQRVRGSVQNEDGQVLYELSSDAVPNTEWERSINMERDEQRNWGYTPNLSIEADLESFDPSGGLSQRPARVYRRERETEDRPPTRSGGRRIVQESGTSDWEFIKKLAKNHGYIVYVFFLHQAKRWIGYWGSPDNVPQHYSYTLKYGYGDDTSLKSARPRISMRGQKTEIDMSLVDPRNGREQRLRVAMDSVNRYSSEFRGPDGTAQIEEPLGDGPEVVLTIHGRRTTVVADRPFTDPEDARRWLMAFWMRHASDFCTMEGETVIGLPEIRARHQHIINGIGRSSGNYFITKTTHKMSETGYNTTFSAFRLADGHFSGVDADESSLLTVDENAVGESNPESNG